MSISSWIKNDCACKNSGSKKKNETRWGKVVLIWYLPRHSYNDWTGIWWEHTRHFDRCAVWLVMLALIPKIPRATNKLNIVSQYGCLQATMRSDTGSRHIYIYQLTAQNHSPYLLHTSIHSGSSRFESDPTVNSSLYQIEGSKMIILRHAISNALKFHYLRKISHEYERRKIR